MLQAKCKNVLYSSNEEYETFIQQAKQQGFNENNIMTKEERESLEKSEFYKQNSKRIIFSESYKGHRLCIARNDSELNEIFDVYAMPYRKTLMTVKIYLKGKLYYETRIKHKHYKHFIEGGDLFQSRFYLVK